MSGRKGSSGHQNLIRYASLKLLNEFLGDDYLMVSLVRESPMDVKTDVEVIAEGLGRREILRGEQRLYCDIVCWAVFNTYAKRRRISRLEPNSDDDRLLKRAEKFKEEGNMAEYRNIIRMITGSMVFIVECETNPRSNLLRDGPRLTSYKLMKQKNPHLTLILAVFEDTKIDHPEIFDEVWRFPRARPKKEVEQ